MMNAASIANSIPKSKRAGLNRFLISCPNPAHADKNPSCLVYDGKNGVGFECLAGCNWRDVRAGAESLSYIEPWKPQKAEYVFNTNKPSSSEPKRDTSSFASFLINSSKAPNLVGPVTSYLTSRAIGQELPLNVSELKTRHSNDNQNYTAMIFAAYVAGSSEPSGCHVTYLNADGTKASVSPNKKMFGKLAGAAVPLAGAGKTLALSEGIESGLSFQQMTGIPTWACLSTSGLKAIKLPELPLASEVVIAADNDAPGRKAAYETAEILTLQGRCAKVVLPQNIKEDWNDVLMNEVKKND